MFWYFITQLTIPQQKELNCPYLHRSATQEDDAATLSPQTPSEHPAVRHSGEASDAWRSGVGVKYNMVIPRDINADWLMTLARRMDS